MRRLDFCNRFLGVWSSTRACVCWLRVIISLSVHVCQPNCVWFSEMESHTMRCITQCSTITTECSNRNFNSNSHISRYMHIYGYILASIISIVSENSMATYTNGTRTFARVQVNFGYTLGRHFRNWDTLRHFDKCSQIAFAISWANSSKSAHQDIRRCRNENSHFAKVAIN